MIFFSLKLYHFEFVKKNFKNQSKKENLTLEKTNVLHVWTVLNKNLSCKRHKTPDLF